MLIVAGIITAILLIVVGALLDAAEERRRAKYWNRLWLTRKWDDD
jgi:hypothetical protein